MSTRDELLEYAQLYQLSPTDVAELTEYSLSSVEAWLMPDRTSVRAREVPQRALSLLKAKIAKAEKSLSN